MSLYPPPPPYYKLFQDSSSRIEPPPIPASLDTRLRIEEIKLPLNVPELFVKNENGDVNYAEALRSLFSNLKKQYSSICDILLHGSDPLPPYHLVALAKIEQPEMYLQFLSNGNNSFSKEIGNLRNVYSNMAFLINKLREHQAKKSVVQAMRDQLASLELKHKNLLLSTESAKKLLSEFDSSKMDVDDVVGEYSLMDTSYREDLSVEVDNGVSKMFYDLDQIPREFLYKK